MRISLVLLYLGNNMGHSFALMDSILMQISQDSVVGALLCTVYCMAI